MNENTINEEKEILTIILISKTFEGILRLYAKKPQIIKKIEENSSPILLDDDFITKSQKIKFHNKALKLINTEIKKDKKIKEVINSTYTVEPELFRNSVSAILNLILNQDEIHFTFLYVRLLWLFFTQLQGKFIKEDSFSFFQDLSSYDFMRLFKNNRAFKNFFICLRNHTEIAKKIILFSNQEAEFLLKKNIKKAS
jgi:hypothetical protein